MKIYRSRQSAFSVRSSISLVAALLFTVFVSLPSLYQSVSGNAGQAKFSSQNTAKNQNKNGAPARMLSPYAKSVGDAADPSRPVLAVADFNLIGLAVAAAPATQTVPKNTPTVVNTTVLVPFGTDPQEIIAGLSPNLRVRGDLVGPSLTSPLTIEAPIGEPLAIPALTRAGDHVLQNLRVVDIGEAGSPTITSVTPDLCAIVVIDQILVSEVRVQELTYDQIIQSGISITDDSYRFFNFVLAMATSSTTVNINLPVAFPDIKSEDPRPVIGRPSAPPQIGVTVPTVDAVPIMLEVEEEGSGVELKFDDQPVRIPGVVVFPGRIGFLNQFFEAIVIVSNGAPAGSPLVVRNLRARVRLPDADTPSDPGDDPLRIAATQTGGAVSELEVRGLGADGKYGTADDLMRFSPGQSGQATFLLEGLREGLHLPLFELEGTLEGLPSGPVTVRGAVPGAVLVRDASFAVTFSHPSIVRAGNEYDLAMTIYNSGNRDINEAIAHLNHNQISGASLIAGDTGERAFETTIPRKGSSTVVWRLRANTTGAVSASYVKVGDGIESGLILTTGVGDRNVALSPESLILPDEVRFLPPSVVEAGRALLGQAWSVASAPRGSLPADVVSITKQTVIDRAIEMGMAGLRVEFGESVESSLMTLIRDWLGELQSTPDPGFGDAIRNTVSGYKWHDTVGDYFRSRMTTEHPVISATDLHSRLAETESARSSFISALITQPEGAALFGASLVDPSGRRTGLLNSPAERVGELSMGAAMRLDREDQGASLGQMLIASRPVDGNWFIEISAWQNGVTDISALVPSNASSYRHILFPGIHIVEGRQYRIRVRPGSTLAPVLEEFRDGAFAATDRVAQVNSISEPAARLVSALQVSDEVMTGGDKYGRLVGLLFSRPMQKTSAEQPSRYTIGGGELAGSEPPSRIGAAINVRTAALQLGGRFVFLALDAPIGPYIRRDISITGVNDARGVPANPSPVSFVINPTVSREGRPPGAWLTGHALLADGTPVANASITYWTQPCRSGEFPAAISIHKTDSEGRYAIDYVRNGDCGGVVITATNPSNGSGKRLSTPVVYDGQHMRLDMVFLARGNVSGKVTSGSAPAPFAFVRVVPHLDASIAPTVQADSLGRYSVDDLPVGPITVSAVGSGSLSTATGIAAGSIDGPGQTATIDVSLQNTSGAVRGQVINPDEAPSAGSLVLARAHLAGFDSTDARGTLVGFALTGRDGSFSITGLPVTQINLEVKDYVTGLSVHQSAHLSQNTTEINGIVILLPGFGSISGKVTDEDGIFIPFAGVSVAGREVLTDALGNYLVTNLRAGTFTLRATEPASEATGEATASVAVNQITSNVNIIITRPGAITGQVFILNSSGQSVTVSGAVVSHDGLTQTTTDSQGRYTIGNVRANTLLTLRFVHPNNRLAVNLNTFVSPGQSIERNATFKSAGLRGRIFQPDGVTGTVAELTIFASMPSLQPGGGFGLLELKEITTQSASDGAYSISQLNIGSYRVRASNTFFPTRVSKGGTLAPGEEEVCNITLVSTLAGRIQGRVFQPDGATPVGAGVSVTLGGGSLADVTVRTDENGAFEFPEAFAEGSYALTATDPATGFTNRITIAVRQNEDVIADIRLLGRGGLRARVIDGAGNPVTGGSITINGTSHPKHQRFAEIGSASDGVVEFSDLSEGSYAISATENGLSGRAEATVANNSVVEVMIQLQASGSVEGRVLMPDSVTPAGLVDVFLSINNRRVGVTVTSDEEGQTGRFKLPLVPTGNFTLEAFDNRSGRTGRAAGTIIAQGETSQIDIILIALGAVTGIVTQNEQPVSHALVSISPSSGPKLQTTTTPDGRYRFTGIPAGAVSISVTNGPGGLTGHATGQVTGTTEPLPDTVINVSLQPSVTILGKVFRFGGAERVAGAKVTLRSGSRVIETTSNQEGEYRIEFAPLGDLTVRAEAAAGFDRGQAPLIAATQPGTAYVADITFDGLGNVAGNALDQNGVTLNAGAVTLTNIEFGSAIVLVAQVQSDGRYELRGAPAGEFSLKLTVPGRVGVGAAVSEIVANQTIELPVRLEDAGTVKGAVRRPDGVTAAASADVMLTLTRSTMSINLLAHTNLQGAFTFENVPLGSVSIRVNDPMTGGIAGASGLALNANGQLLDAGELILDNTPVRVESVIPANGGINVSRNTNIAVTFSEPVLASTIDQGTMRLLKGSSLVARQISLSSDGRVATITPSSLLEDFTTYAVIVTTSVKDLAGIHLAEEFRSSFITRDETAPQVVLIQPLNLATEVTVDSPVVVTFNEPLDATQDLSSVVTLLTGSEPLTTVAGAVSLDASGRMATFRASAPLAESTKYTVRVTGQQDQFGNTQVSAFTSSFTTIDRTPPVIDPLAIDQTTQATKTPTISATYRDDSSGINLPSIILKLDGINITSAATVTATSLTFQPSAPLAVGVHSISIQIADNTGNLVTRDASFSIDDTPPVITSFQIGGVTAVSGITVTSSLQPLFEASYTDSSGIDAGATRLLFGPAGAGPVQVAAAVSQNGLTFQPESNLAEGMYAAELIIVDILGNSATTGRIEFRLDADAPEIMSVTPASGNQHGGTRVTIAGARLLNSNNTAPFVKVADQSAIVSNITISEIDTVTIITPASPPGPASITITTDRGTQTLPSGFAYDTDMRLPFALEPDTRLLWRLDEAGNGSALIVDAGPLSIDGTAHALSQSRPGRFGGGRANADISGDTDFGGLAFGTSSFTVEVWMKSGPVQRSYTIAGRGRNRPTQTDSEDFALVLKPTGSLEGYLFDTSGAKWLVSMASTVYDIDDDQWHSVAMVVDRASAKLMLYVDGVERAVAMAPGGFGAMRAFGRRVAVGTFTRGGENGPSEFPGIIDEVRFSASAHSADKIASDIFGINSVRVTTIIPGIIQKGAGPSSIRFFGTGLIDTSVSSLREDIAIEVIKTTFHSIDLMVSTQETVPLGPLQFTITDSTGQTAVIEITVVDQKPFENDPASILETILLWHLDEADDGAVAIDGSGDPVLPAIISGTASGFSFAAPGRFGGGRRKADIVALQSSSSFPLGAGSFTIECWIKSDPVTRRYALVTRSDFIGNTDDFSLALHPSGVLEAFLFDTTGKKWQTFAQPVTYSANQSTIARVDDGQWHLITMVVDRLSEELRIYVDSQERGIASAPVGFGAVRNAGHPFRVGLQEVGGENGVREFPGVIDEVRIVNFARTAEEIRETWFGTSGAGGVNLKALQKSPAPVVAVRNQMQPPRGETLFRPRLFPLWFVKGSDSPFAKGGRQ